MTSDGASPSLGGEAAQQRRLANWAAAGAVLVLGLAIAVSGSAVASALVAQNVTEDIGVPEISTIDQAPRGVVIDITDSTTVAGDESDSGNVDDGATGSDSAAGNADANGNSQGDENKSDNAPVVVLPATPAVPNGPGVPATPAKPATPSDNGNQPTKDHLGSGK